MLAALALLLLPPTLVVAPHELVLHGDFELRAGWVRFDGPCNASALAELPMTLPVGVWRVDVPWTGDIRPTLSLDQAGQREDTVEMIGQTAILRATRPARLSVRMSGGLAVQGGSFGPITLRRIRALPGELSPIAPPAWVRGRLPADLAGVRPRSNPIPEVIELTRYVAGTLIRQAHACVPQIETLAMMDDDPAYDYAARLADQATRCALGWSGVSRRGAGPTSGRR